MAGRMYSTPPKHSAALHQNPSSPIRSILRTAPSSPNFRHVLNNSAHGSESPLSSEITELRHKFVRLLETESEITAVALEIAKREADQHELQHQQYQVANFSASASSSSSSPFPHHQKGGPNSTYFGSSYGQSTMLTLSETELDSLITEREISLKSRLQREYQEELEKVRQQNQFAQNSSVLERDAERERELRELRQKHQNEIRSLQERFVSDLSAKLTAAHREAEARISAMRSDYERQMRQRDSKFSDQKQSEEEFRSRLAETTREYESQLKHQREQHQTQIRSLLEETQKQLREQPTPQNDHPSVPLETHQLKISQLKEVQAQLEEQIQSRDTQLEQLKAKIDTQDAEINKLRTLTTRSVSSSSSPPLVSLSPSKESDEFVSTLRTQLSESEERSKKRFEELQSQNAELQNLKDRCSALQEKAIEKDLTIKNLENQIKQLSSSSPLPNGKSSSHQKEDDSSKTHAKLIAYLLEMENSTKSSLEERRRSLDRSKAILAQEQESEFLLRKRP